MILSSKLLGSVSVLGKEFLVLALVVLVVSILLSSYLQQRRLSFIPGLRPLPIIGNAHQIAPQINRFVDWITDITEYYGGTTRLWIASNAAVFTSDMDLIQNYFISPQSMGNFERNTFQSVIEYMLGDGLISSKGKHWEFSRKALAPSFTATTLKNFVPILVKRAEELVETIAAKCERQAIPICDDLLMCTFLTIAETHLQLREHDLKDPAEVLSKMNLMMNLMQQRGFTPWQQPEKLYHHLPSGSLALKTKHYLNSFLESARQKAVERIEERKLEGDYEWKKKVFINVLIANGGYTKKQVIDELATIFAAGSETTANSLGFVLLILGQHQDIQQKVYDEDLKILEDSCGREFNNADLNKYEYLDRVIKEALRIFPIVPLFYNRLTQDLKYGKHIIPGGAELIVHTLLVHRNPNTYPDPLKFDPDRFLPENISKRHPFSYLPFGTGSRICLGQRFSTMSTKIIISTIIRNFHIYNDTPIDKLALQTNLTMKDANNVTLRFERR